MKQKALYHLLLNRLRSFPNGRFDLEFVNALCDSLRISHERNKFHLSWCWDSQDFAIELPASSFEFYVVTRPGARSRNWHRAESLIDEIEETSYGRRPASPTRANAALHETRDTSISLSANPVGGAMPPGISAATRLTAGVAAFPYLLSTEGPKIAEALLAIVAAVLITEFLARLYLARPDYRLSWWDGLLVAFGCTLPAFLAISFGPVVLYILAVLVATAAEGDGPRSGIVRWFACGILAAAVAVSTPGEGAATQLAGQTVFASGIPFAALSTALALGLLAYLAPVRLRKAQPLAMLVGIAVAWLLISAHGPGVTMASAAGANIPTSAISFILALLVGYLCVGWSLMGTLHLMVPWIALGGLFVHFLAAGIVGGAQDTYVMGGAILACTFRLTTTLVSSAKPQVIRSMPEQR